MTGKIYKRQGTRGISYWTIVDLPQDPETGARRQTKITAPTKKELEGKVAELTTAKQTGNFIEPDTQNITVTQYLDKWLESITQTLKPASYRSYADLMHNHVVPHIGKKLLSKLTAMDVQVLYTKCEADLSSTTVRKLHNVLHRALKQAVKWKLLQHNVTEDVDAPRESNPEQKTWNAQQVVRFLEVSDRDELAALWRLALFTGMRRGEILGLKWGDLDLDRRLVSVQRTYSRGIGSAFAFGQPKSAKGRRIVVLPVSVAESLHKHRKVQLEVKFGKGSAYTDNQMVFADVTGEPVHPNTLRKHFVKLLADAGVPYIRFHDLRHTHATLMLRNNVNPKIVSERLGHANIGITLDRYSHVSEDMQRDAADDLETLIAGTDSSEGNDLQKAQ